MAVTVTADAAGFGDGKPVKQVGITITGDLTYEKAVVDAAGNPINQDARNVLGIFARGGNIEVPSFGSNRAPDNLMVHASMAAFELKDSQGNVITGPQGEPLGGRIRSDVTNWRSTPHRGNFTLVGGMQATFYDNFGVYDGRMHGFTYKGVWDSRYDKNFSPAWYPGYYVDTLNPEAGSQVTVRSNTPMVVSYKRVYYGSLPSR
jgi:hypothetical protein